VYDDTELKTLREEVEKQIGKQLDIFGDEDGSSESSFRYVEIFAAASLGRLVAQLEKKGFAMEHYETTGKPLYHLRNGGEKDLPIASLRDLLDTVRDLGRNGLAIQRYKGLGEMNPDQLFDTTMDPASRKLLKVVIGSQTATDDIFSTLMGEEVEPRRLFIEANSLNVKNLDI